MPFAVNWKEDGSCELLARFTARNGSGAYTGQRGEGRFIKQVDVVSIHAEVTNRTIDPTGLSPVEIDPLVASVIIDDPDDSGEVWALDDIGYNFRHAIAGTYFPEGGNIYRVEYKVTLVGAVVIYDYFEGPALGNLQD